MMPTSWTMKGGLLLLLCSLLVLGLGARIALTVEDLDRAQLAIDWLGGWWSALPMLAGIVGVYGARNLPLKGRAPTSAEMAQKPQEAL